MYKIADAHCDTLSASSVYGRTGEKLMVNPDRLKEGGVAIQTFAMFGGGEGDPVIAYDRAHLMLGLLDTLQVPIYTKELPDELPDTPHGILSIEGGEMIGGSLEKLHELNDIARIRMIALTWNNENEIGYPALNDCGKGLKPFGIQLLKEMDRLGILADVSHLNERGFYDIAEHMELPLIASHSNMKKLCGHFRNLTDDQIKVIIEKKGFIGMNFCVSFLRDDGQTVTTDDIMRHIDGIAELGGIDVVGFGSDFDGITKRPVGMEDPSRFQDMMELLDKHGYTKEQLEKIAGGNMFRVLKQAEKKCTVCSAQ